MARHACGPGAARRLAGIGQRGAACVCCSARPSSSRSSLALITRQRATRKAAKQVGVPVFADAAAAAGDRWHMDPLLPPIDPQQPDRDLPDPPPWRRQDEVKRMRRPTLAQARQDASSKR